jgi:hypothetical protein
MYFLVAVECELAVVADYNILVQVLFVETKFAGLNNK